VVASRTLRAQEESERRLERGERKLVDAQRPEERVFPDAVDHRGASEEKARLRPPDELVARAADEVRPEPEALRQLRLGRHRHERAGAQVVHHGHVSLAAERDQLGERDVVGEPHDAEVARVHAEKQRRLGADRAGVVGKVRAVRRADLAQPHAGGREDVGHPEGAADLHELAAAEDRLAPGCERVQREERGGGVVVDHRRRLRPRERREHARHRGLAPNALPLLAVDRDHAVPRRLAGDRIDRGLREHRAPEPRVQHDAGRVDAANDPGREPSRETLPRERGESFGIGLGPRAPSLLEHPGAHLVDDGAHLGVDEPRQPALLELPRGRRLEHAVDGGKLPQACVGVHRSYGTSPGAAGILAARSGAPGGPRPVWFFLSRHRKFAGGRFSRCRSRRGGRRGG